MSTDEQPDSVTLAAASRRLESLLADPDSGPPLDGAELQRLLAATVCAYAALCQAAGAVDPFPPAGAGGVVPNASDVCLVATQMLEAVSVEVFELAMWKTWSAIGAGAGTAPDA
jgi:hypothetical protein